MSFAADEFARLAARFPEPMLLVERDGTVAAANAAAVTALGLPEDPAGASLLDRVAEGPEKLLDYLRLCARSGTFLPGSLTCGDGDGAGTAFRCEGMAARDGEPATSGRVLLRLRPRERAGARFVLLNRKIEELARENARRRRAEAEREALLAAERAARQEAEEANRLKDEFLATVSHELRTPLNAISGWANLLAMPELGAEKRQRGVETIRRNARALSQLVDDLLDVSRVVSGRMRLEVRPVDPAAVVEAAADSVAPAAEARQIRLDVVADPDTGLVSGDHARLQQVMWNLLSNAVKFTPRGGRVRAEVARVGSQAEITVTDSGEGIDPEFLPHVFDAFRQRDSSITRVHQGLGLGLAIVRRLVEAHGGTVSAESPGRGAGATFRVRLPLRVLAGPAALEPVARRRARTGDPGRPRRDEQVAEERLDGVTVLVVEDDPDAREMLFSLFESRGARVLAASSAREARELLGQRPVQVIVSDIQMPGEDGYSFLRRLRASDGAGAAVPAVALTAHGRSEDRLEALRAGFQMHVAKPVEPTELVAVVASLARRPTAG
ncbi:MAG TPA: hybrid sensor histidine kinase/response regulator [Thermoanaerobaculia bacterium]|nr:hybrid sensor histidine kinase/response regulator [Thermoanaerobaculia bacterium]